MGVKLLAMTRLSQGYADSTVDGQGGESWWFVGGHRSSSRQYVAIENFPR